MSQIIEPQAVKTLKHKPPLLQRKSVGKINLFLHIVGRRSDGYHDLQSVFRLLDWGDMLRFWLSEQSFDPIRLLQTNALPIDLHCEQTLTAHPHDNLIVKAAFCLLKWLQSNHQLPASLPFVTIHLDKNLPTGAGLGGGSSNAATTLLALNQLWQLNLDRQILQTIGAQIGADVPIFLFGLDAIAEGIGEQLTAIKLLPQQYLMLCPQAHISTAKLFAHPKLKRDMPPLSVAAIKHQATEYLFQLNSPYCNVFEPVVCQLSPTVAHALAYLRTLEPLTHSTARMTGSGSCVFLPFLPQHVAQIKAAIAQAPCPAKIVNTTNAYAQIQTKP